MTIHIYKVSSSSNREDIQQRGYYEAVIASDENTIHNIIPSSFRVDSTKIIIIGTSSYKFNCIIMKNYSRYKF